MGRRERTAVTLFDHFAPRSPLNDLVQDLKWDRELRARFKSHQQEVLDSYALTEAQRAAVENRDFRAALNQGLHPYLLSQLARLLFGNSEKEGASEAASALIKSLWGEDYDRYMAGRST